VVRRPRLRPGCGAQGLHHQQGRPEGGWRGWLRCWQLAARWAGCS
jgi:hypothetical protein